VRVAVRKLCSCEPLERKGIGRGDSHRSGTYILKLKRAGLLLVAARYDADWAQVSVPHIHLPVKGEVAVVDISFAIFGILLAPRWQAGGQS